MKKQIIALAIALPTLVFGQVDRTKQPAAQKATKINIKDSEVFTTENGITVILSENHKLPTVSFAAFMGSDPKLEKEKAGLSEISGSLIMSGTTNRTKDQLDNEVDYIGANLDASSNSISLSCLTKHMEKGLSLMADVTMNANFPESEFNRIVKQFESSLLSAKSDPSTMAQNAVSKVNFPNHPFGEVMSEKTLKNISREDVINYYKSNFSPKGAYIVVVGDITKEQTKAMIQKYFGTWNGVAPYKQAYTSKNINKGNRVIFVKKPGAVQSVIQVSFPIDMIQGDANQLPTTVLNTILGGSGFGSRMMQNLREDKAYTYGCYSSLNITENGSWLSAGGNFRNDVTDSAIVQILMELDKIANGYVTDEELNLIKSSMAGSFARSLERPQTIARFALNIIKYNLAKDYYQTYLTRLENVNKDDVLTMAQTYLTAKNCNIIVVGNEAILEKLKVFDADGKIEFVDAFGDELKEMKKADITKEKLIENYLLAVTKSANAKEVAKKLKKVKSLVEVSDISIPQAPFPIKNTKVWVSPATEGSKLEGQGMVFQRTFFDGKSGYAMSMQTGKKELTAEEIVEKQKTSGLFPELNYTANQINYELLGIESLNGKDVYVLKIAQSKGESFDYFDASSFMKVKSFTIQKEEEETQEITMEFGDFKEVNGILFPFTTNLIAGGATLSGKVSSLKINEKVDLSEYK